ncbi:MAG: 50S ribosomal protein L25 [Chitinophagales bacterium]|nr:50S ribosomal protein L25 [Chitinophagales bacterium]MDW8274679.1 50S ribosomal protein L25 [Chitinophagales bacterium]
METVIINGTARTELGKKATRALREAGNVPCNLYGGEKNVNFYAPLNQFRKLVYTSDFKVAEIHVDGQTYRAIVKEIQFDPVTDAIRHLDFQELVPGRAVKVSLPLRLKGTPKGAAMGGKLEQTIKRLNVLAKPEFLRESIELNVEDMDLGAIKRIRDIQIEGIELLHAPAIPVARMSVPRAAKEAAAEAKKEAATAQKK